MFYFFLFPRFCILSGPLYGGGAKLSLGGAGGGAIGGASIVVRAGGVYYSGAGVSTPWRYLSGPGLRHTYPGGGIPIYTQYTLSHNNASCYNIGLVPKLQTILTSSRQEFNHQGGH